MADEFEKTATFDEMKAAGHADPVAARVAACGGVMHKPTPTEYQNARENAKQAAGVHRPERQRPNWANAGIGTLGAGIAEAHADGLPFGFVIHAEARKEMTARFHYLRGAVRVYHDWMATNSGGAIGAHIREMIFQYEHEMKSIDADLDRERKSAQEMAAYAKRKEIERIAELRQESLELTTAYAENLGDPVTIGKLREVNAVLDAAEKDAAAKYGAWWIPKPEGVTPEPEPVPDCDDPRMYCAEGSPLYGSAFCQYWRVSDALDEAADSIAHGLGQGIRVFADFLRALAKD